MAWCSHLLIWEIIWVFDYPMRASSSDFYGAGVEGDTGGELHRSVVLEGSSYSLFVGLLGLLADWFWLFTVLQAALHAEGGGVGAWGAEAAAAARAFVWETDFAAGTGILADAAREHCGWIEGDVAAVVTDGSVGAVLDEGGIGAGFVVGIAEEGEDQVGHVAEVEAAEGTEDCRFGIAEAGLALGIDVWMKVVSCSAQGFGIVVKTVMKEIAVTQATAFPTGRDVVICLGH